MQKPNLTAIRGKVSDDARIKFEELWEFYLVEKRWPTDRWIYKRLPKPKFDSLLKSLNGSYVQEMDSGGFKTYELQPFGVLCTTNGDRYVALLRRYIDYVRHVYFDNDRQNNVTSTELIANAGFLSDETIELGRVLDGNVFYIRPGGAPDFSTWSAALPANLGDMWMRAKRARIVPELLT